MLIHEKGPFVRGSILLVSFLVLFCVLLTPIMKDEKGNHLTGLQYADNVFNELSKGSSYFIPSVREHVKTVEKVNVKVTVTMKKAELAETAVQVLTNAETAAAANLKLTSLYDLAIACGITDAEGFVQHFIDYEREVARHEG